MAVKTASRLEIIMNEKITNKENKNLYQEGKL